ncbi:esterase/lipase family protein [Aerosakkonemataceae cyanobacterium BLCC-F50]|uniref:Esterase/lipase family protein n=1 Tax=Floridaenema flaviceps BLCC-F50 TaxID=3153642 RepID=A0ABV4XP23_9CYAN
MSEPTRRPLPLILIRGFGGFDTSDEKKNAYQGFTEGTVYPQKQGENYIYEGLILRFMKSNWKYQDATNVVGYYNNVIDREPLIPEKLQRYKDPNIIAKFMHFKELGYFSGDKVIIDAGMALNLLENSADISNSIWIFRYYDLDDRVYETYGKALVRLIDFIIELTSLKTDRKPKVNIIAHSMGGLLVQQAVQVTYPEQRRKAEDYINKIVTLGTPHQGVTIQIIKNWLNIAAADDLKHFNPDFMGDKNNPISYNNFGKHFPLHRLLTIVGTNYRSYNNAISSRFNRLFSLEDELGINYNRSDGLVKQNAAQIPGSARTFVHKCHGGPDSLLTARESFEIATRFFFGNVRVRLRFVKGTVTRGKDFFGKSEFFLGVSIKPRGVDFELFHQSREAENCYGPFKKVAEQDKNINFSEQNQEMTFPWADDNKLIWEGYLNIIPILKDESIINKDMVIRLDFYVGERDLFGIGFSDNIIFHKQYYIRTLFPTENQSNLLLYRHTDEQFVDPNFQPPEEDKMPYLNGGWQFDVKGTGFEATFRIEIDEIPEDGEAIPFVMN